MRGAYIFCPDVITDTIDKTSKHYTFSVALISRLHDERFRVTTRESKRFRGFISDYHKSKMIDMAIEIMDKDEIGEDEIYNLAIILGALEEEGLDFEEYRDDYTPLFDLAEQLEDTYDVFIVCNNGRAKEVQDQNMSLKKYKIITSEEAFQKVF